MTATMVVPIINDLSDLLQHGIRYGTFFADPPWPETDGGKIKRGADRHYPLMMVADIVAMGGTIQQLVKPDSHLYLWVTNNHLPDALDVMKAWGFRSALRETRPPLYMGAASEPGSLP